VFPIHHTPTLVLAGRITGEARQVHVYQRSRHRKSWLWDSNTTPQLAGAFKVSGLTDTQTDEVLFTVELTAHIDKSALPDDLARAVTTRNMPWVRLTTDTPSGECITRKEDLTQVIDVARKTINAIQDKVRAKRIHLIVISPASAAFSIGQLIQAGHHAIFTLYDRPSGQQLFKEAFSISGHTIAPPTGSLHPSISIR
jgi:DNA-binding XRE family transcriptional regulator